MSYDDNPVRQTEPHFYDDEEGWDDDLCPPDCGHTDAEHAAFDQGFSDASQTGQNKNPFSPQNQYQEWDAYETGASSGLLEYNGQDHTRNEGSEE